MCGIIGYVSVSDTVLDSEKTMFLQDALILDTWRGEDSTGLVTVADDWDVRSEKQLVRGWEFIQTEEYCDMPNGWAAIGHNRAATKGKVNVNNAHPFVAGPITLVHNGTLHNMGRNLPEYSSKIDVDSENIARALASVDPAEAHTVLSMIDGAFALVWTDDRDQSINNARNNQRPLHFAYNTNKTVLWFMSDARHLEMLKKRKWCMGMDMGEIYQFSTGNHLKWLKGSITPEVVTPFVPFTRPVQTYHGGYNGGYSGQVYTPAWRQEQPTGSGQSAPLPKVQTPLPTTPSQDRSSTLMLLNGRIESVPEALRVDLKLATELTVEQKLDFTPDYWVPYPAHDGVESKFGYAVGTVKVESWDVDWGAQVHNVARDIATAIDRNWTVRAFGVSDQDVEDYGTIIMCRIVSFSAMNKQQIAEDIANNWQADEESAEFWGPADILLTEAEWETLTKHGCSYCSTDLYLDEHEDVVWEHNDPLCEDCGKLFQERDKYDEQEYSYSEREKYWRYH